MIERYVIMSTVKIKPIPMTPDERAVVGLLLAPDLPGAEVLRRQALSAVVLDRCDCGCPTIGLGVPEVASLRAPYDGRVWPVEGRVAPANSDEPAQEIILFLKDGRLSSLELVHYSSTPPTAWPNPADISVE